MSPDLQRNYFELFDLPVGFDVDLTMLAARYRDLQRRLHPDRFVSAADAERRLSMQLTALVNEAYQTLKDPVRRAHYLLQLDGARADSEADTAMDPEFLMEQMELREALAEMRESAEPHKRLAELANEAERRMNEKMNEFRTAYTQGQGARARERLREMQFLAKLRREIEDLEEELA
jgi:molecular chaperone HscB